MISVVRGFWPRSPFIISHRSLTNGSRDYTGVLRMRRSISKQISVIWCAISVSSRNRVSRNDFWITLSKPLGFHMIVNMNFLLWISSLGFVTMSSLDRVHIRPGYLSKKTTTHHWSQDDASHQICQHARIPTSLLRTPFVFRANHMPIDASLKVKWTIRSE
jgi:hypothetical protein